MVSVPVQRLVVVDGREVINFVLGLMTNNEAVMGAVDCLSLGNGISADIALELRPDRLHRLEPGRPLVRR